MPQFPFLCPHPMSLSRLAAGCLVLFLLGCGTTAPTTKSASAPSAPVPTSPPRPTSPPAPTVTPRPTPLPSPTPAPVRLSGQGQDVTRAVQLPAAIVVVELRHSGSRNFIVKAHIGGREELLANKIGGYHGLRPLVGPSPVTFAVSADGAWSIVLKPLTGGGQPAVSGTGDYVSALFSAPSAGAWEVQHTGKRNFIVKLHCRGGSDLVQNKIGAVGGSVFVTFPQGPCFWEIEADGRWSLRPRG